MKPQRPPSTPTGETTRAHLQKEVRRPLWRAGEPLSVQVVVVFRVLGLGVGVSQGRKVTAMAEYGK
jgi:hypothetical protein